MRDAPLLKAALKQAAREADATLMASDEFGDHYRIDHPIRNGDQRRMVRSGWTIRAPGGPPYLTKAFGLPWSHG